MSPTVRLRLSSWPSCRRPAGSSPTGADHAHRFLIEVNQPGCPGLATDPGELPTIGRADIVSWKRYDAPAGREEDPAGRFARGIERVLSREQAAEIAVPFEGPFAGHYALGSTAGVDPNCGFLTFPVSQAAVIGWAQITRRGSGNDCLGVFDVRSPGHGFGGGTSTTPTCWRSERPRDPPPDTGSPVRGWRQGQAALALQPREVAWASPAA